MPAIPPHNTPTVDTPWDGPGAIAAAPNEAAVLRYMTAWVDPSGDPDAKGSYKFPHHSGQGAPANLAGVRNALARLSNADIPDADRAGVERHLRDHLDDAQRGIETVHEDKVQTRFVEGFCLRDYKKSDDKTLRFVAATEGTKGDGINLRMQGADLERFRKSPVIMWAHDYSRPPIGRADVQVENGMLMADVTFDESDPFAADIARKYRDGFLSAVSVGFDFSSVERDGTVNNWELLEISAVPVPMDPDALLARQRAADVASADEPITAAAIREIVASELAKFHAAPEDTEVVINVEPEELDAEAVRAFRAAFDKGEK